MAVDWSKPIEAAHEDGRVVPVTFAGDDKADRLPISIRPPVPSREGGVAQYFNRDGSRTGNCGWRIRNVQPAATKPAISDELVERAFTLIKEMAATPDHLKGSWTREAAAIVAELPQRVDPDVLAVRKIMHAQQRAMTPPDSGWGNMSYEKGSYDHTEQFQAALAAYRALERGEP